MRTTAPLTKMTFEIVRLTAVELKQPCFVISVLFVQMSEKQHRIIFLVTVLVFLYAAYIHSGVQLLPLRRQPEHRAVY